MEKKSFVARCREFFGLKEGQKLTEFATELRALTHKDKLDLCAEFERAGMPTEPPIDPTAPGNAKPAAITLGKDGGGI